MTGKVTIRRARLKKGSRRPVLAVGDALFGWSGRADDGRFSFGIESVKDPAGERLIVEFDYAAAFAFAKYVEEIAAEYGITPPEVQP